MAVSAAAQPTVTIAGIADVDIAFDGTEAVKLNGLGGDDTVNASAADITTLPPAVEEAFDNSQGLVLEVILDPGSQAKMGQAMILSDGRRLNQIIGPELSGQVAVTAARYGMPPAELMA